MSKNNLLHNWFIHEPSSEILKFLINSDLFILIENILISDVGYIVGYAHQCVIETGKKSQRQYPLFHFISPSVSNPLYNKISRIPTYTKNIHQHYTSFKNTMKRTFLSTFLTILYSS